MRLTAQRILDAALEVFGTHGYQQASMGLVAAQAGLSRPALYRHFGTKETLFLSVVEDLHDRSIERGLRAAQAADSDGPAAVLTALLSGRLGDLVERLYSRPHGLELVAESNHLCGDLNRAASARFQRLLMQAIQHESERGRLDLRRTHLNAEVLADLLLRAAYGLKARDPSPLSPAEFQTSAQLLVRLLTAGLLPERTPS